MSDDRNQPSDIFDENAATPDARPDSAAEAEALVEAAERKRRKPRRAAEAPAAAKDSEPASEAAEEADPPSTKRKRRRAAAAPRDATGATAADDDSALPATPAPRQRGPSAWAAACICAALAVLVLSAAALASLPRALPVDRVVVDWLDGPHATQREVDGWLATFPEREQLVEANGWVMSRLSEHLLAQPGVGEVRRLELRHEPAADGRLGRTLHVEMGMRRPYMPGVLASGQRVWLDAEGVILPGTLPGPERRRPLVRDLEAGAGLVRAAVDAWRRLEPAIDPNLVTSIDCNDLIDERGERGIVLQTRANARLVWGRPDEERTGRDAEAKTRDLVHTLRCQGDLGRVAVVNVRFAQPFYTLK